MLPSNEPRRRATCRVSVVCAVITMLAQAASAEEAPPLETLLERAGAYVARYAETFRDVVAEEDYRQWWNDPNRSKSEVRTLRSDMVFAVVPGPLPWTVFRDVFEVDGRAVRDRQDRLERLFVDSPHTAAEQAQAILRESSRHNVGPLPGEGGERTVNVPTLGLLFLQPANQKRLSIEIKGRRSFDGLETVEVGFEEEASPTLIHDRDLNDVPARGRFWIDPSRGVVIRTEVEYNLEPERRERRQVAFISTVYRREPGLDIFVPSEMKETWELAYRGRIEGIARYSNYRRFRVTTEESDPRRVPSETCVVSQEPAEPALDPAAPGPLTVALEGKALPRDLPLQAAAVHLAGAGDERDVVVAVKVPLSAANVEQRSGPRDRGEANGELSLLVLVRDADGRLAARLSCSTPLSATGSEATRGRSLVVTRGFRLAPGRYTLEAAVLDRTSGRVGASRVAFEVPAATGLALGSLVVVRPEPSVEGSDDLLRAGNVRGTPRLGEPFASAEGDTVGAFVSLHPGESSEPPELTLEVSRNGDVVSRAVADLPGPDTSGRVTHLVQLPAEAFAPGRYVLRARARQGTEEATAATSFRVVAPEASMAPAGDKERMAVPVNVPADAAPILEAAARYLVEFQEKFQDLVAEESYRQWAGSEIRTLRSDVVFVTLDRSVPWVTLRDVFEVDGQEVRDREERLQELFLERDASTLERADAILRESARFNLGPAYRTINAPTFSLVMLLPEHRGRFTWERKGSREFHGRTGVELRAVESRRPTLVRDTTGADVPAEVQFWIEPGTGRVLSASVHYLFPVESNRQRGAASEQPSAWVDTHYRPEPSLALWVPDSMYERYENVTGQSLWSGKSFEIIEARARYSEYRRFEVETSEGDARVGESEATRSSERRSRQTPP